MEGVTEQGYAGYVFAPRRADLINERHLPSLLSSIMRSPRSKADTVTTPYSINLRL